MSIKKMSIQRGDWTIVLNERVPGSPQVEIRNFAGVVIVVSLGDGYIYKYYGKHQGWLGTEDPLDSVRGINVHLAASGPIQCTFDEWYEIGNLVALARAILELVVTTRLAWEGDPSKENAFPGLSVIIGLGDMIDDLGV